MKKNFKIWFFALLLAIFMTTCEDEGNGNGSGEQTWTIVEESGNTAELTVESSGDFTGTGWSGNAPGCGNYDIPITDGLMSGTSMTFDMSASYCNGQGTISGSCSGTLNSKFPNATSASGTCSGTISDPLGTNDFTLSWTATRTSGDNGDDSDTTPPSVPTDLTCNAISSTEIEHSWTSSTDNVGVAGYNIYRNGTKVGTSTSNSYTDTSLAQNIEYCYTVSAYDVAGNESDQSSQCCTTILSDTTPPSVPTDLTCSTISSTEIELSWATSTDSVGVTGYNVYRNGTKVGTSTSNSYTDTGLTQNTEYCFTVSAYDVAGNESDQSSQYCTTTWDTPEPEPGEVWTWGYNYDGQLGDGTNNNSPRPILVSSITDIVTIAGGSYHSIALQADGTVWTWGRNDFGQLGDGTTNNSPTPVQVNGLTDVINIAGGSLFSFALKSDGTVWTWGWGKGSSNSITPTQVNGLINIIAIAGGANHSLALKSDGTVWAWGRNPYGQLGDGTIDDRESPIQVNNLTDIVAITGGYGHSIAVQSDGTVWAWGWNERGQLGDGTNNNSPIPILVSSLTDIVAIAGGTYHSIALQTDGTVWAWGRNPYGQLGDGTTSNSSIPIQVNYLTDIIDIAGGDQHSLALKSDGTVWAWGLNAHGQLGDGTNNLQSNTPTQTIITNINKIATKGHHSIAANTGQ